MKKIIAILLVVSTIFGLCVGLTGCGKDDPSATDPINPTTSTTQTPSFKDVKITNEIISDFNLSLMKHLDSRIPTGENYMVSPLSLRYALALATIGADGETQDGLLKATGFKTIDEYVSWCNSINEMVKQFDKTLQLDVDEFNKTVGKYNENAIPPSRKLLVANSIWHNKEYGKLKDEYLNNTKNLFGAEANNLPISEFKPKINKWVSEKTNNLIPELLTSDPDNDLNTILINTLYLKSAWSKSFYEHQTKELDFTTYDNKKVKKEFMNQVDSFKYYEDKDLQVVILPLDGNINVAFAIGDTKNLAKALETANFEMVNVTIPKFEIETTLQGDIICDYMKENGAELAFSKTGNADFSPMIEDFEIYIADIIQKTKIKVDEEGLEAAAVTAIMMDNATSISPSKPQPKIFKADKPFSFYIYSNDELPKELLFYGEMNK